MFEAACSSEAADIKKNAIFEGASSPEGSDVENSSIFEAASSPKSSEDPETPELISEIIE